MKIYFAGSIRGGRQNRELYLELIKHLDRYGKVLTEHIGGEELSAQGEATIDEFIFQRDLDWIIKSDVLIAEVSTPSLGVGYELGKAESLGKRILCLYHIPSPNNLSAMVSGNDSFTVKHYENLEEAQQYIDDFFGRLCSTVDYLPIALCNFLQNAAD